MHQGQAPTRGVGMGDHWRGRGAPELTLEGHRANGPFVVAWAVPDPAVTAPALGVVVCAFEVDVVPVPVVVPVLVVPVPVLLVVVPVSVVVPVVVPLLVVVVLAAACVASPR